MFRKTLHIILFVCLCIPAATQNSEYRSFENIGLGPEASVVSCFMQDTQGLIWIGSDKGLFSYDGYSVQQHFVFGTRNNTRIYCGTVVDSSRLYLGADNGLLIYNYRTDRYEEPETKFPSDIRAIVLRKNILWLGSLNGLYAYNLTTKELREFNKEKHQGLPHSTIYCIICSEDDKLYIGTYNGLCRYIPETDVFEKINLPVGYHQNNQFINSLLEDQPRNCIWVGTEGNLFKYDLRTGKADQIDIFHDNSVKSLALDGKGNLLAGTDNGLYVYRESASVLHISHDSRNPHSLSNNIIWNIFTDKEKNIWLGTDYGISLDPRNDNFRYIPISRLTGTGEGNHFYSLFRDSRGIFWFGGTNGLIRFNKSGETYLNTAWYRMGNPEFSLPHNRIRQVYEDKDHQLWIASDGGINRYDYVAGRFIRYNIVDSTGTYNSNWVYHIFEDNHGKLWIATCLGGIFVVDKHKLMESELKNFVAEYNFSTSNGLSGMFVNQIVPDNEGNVWVLLYNNAINKIDTRTYKVTKIPVSEWTNETTLNYIICDRSGRIWVGFRGGVACVQPGSKAPEIVRFDSFSKNEVLAMVEVDNYIWVSTTDGVWVIDKQTLLAKRLNIMNRGFASLFYDQEDHCVYMGGVDGFTTTSLDLMKVNEVDYPLYLTALYVNNRLFAPQETNAWSIRYSDAIELDYKQNNLSFEFSDYPYSLEDKNKFVYKLSGVDEDWNLLKQNVNRITYNNLDYGDYKLVISKLDMYGKPSEKHYTLSIRIHPPWYYSFWAKTLYAILFISLIVWTVNFFRVKNRLKYERMEKAKILEQSRSKIDFFTNISHDFKTPLSMIVGPVSKLILEVKNLQEKKQLEVIRRNAMKLNSLIHQVLDFDRVDSHTNTMLILSKVEFVSFARSLFDVFEEEAVKEKQVECSFQTNREKIFTDIDVIKFESIFNNLLSNALKFTPAGGKISLSLNLKADAGLVDISVSDNGVGIPPQDIPYIFQRFFQSSRTSGKNEGTGIGLYLVKTYSELHGGYVGVVSEENTGTTITVTLPLQIQENTVAEEQPLHDEAVKANCPLILIVEDNPEIASFIVDILHAKYRCEVAENGKIGLERCLGLLPELVIADVMMPVMNGLEMCRRIKKNIPTSTIPLILLTAKNDKETELESLRLQVDAFISKPFEPDILMSRVEQLLTSKQQMEKKARMDVITTPQTIEAVSYDEKFLSNITKIIEEHISDSDLNVNFLCEISGTGNKQLYRKIKQLTGMTPVDYIKSIRMKKAAMLLNQKKFSVAEVMYMVGFSNHSYFSKCFQSEFGKTPRQFMEDKC